MPLLPAAPDGRDEVGRLQHPDVLRGRLPGHRQVLAQFAQCLEDLLGEEVRLDFVGRYASSDDWQFVAGVVEAQPAIIVIDPCDATQPPQCVVLLRLEAGRVAWIRVFRHAR